MKIVLSFSVSGSLRFTIGAIPDSSVTIQTSCVAKSSLQVPYIFSFSMSKRGKSWPQTSSRHHLAPVTNMNQN